MFCARPLMVGILRNMIWYRISEMGPRVFNSSKYQELIKLTFHPSDV